MNHVATRYPLWPVTAYLVLTPLWWALGVIDFVLLPLGLVMALYLGAAGPIRAPRCFSLWLLFLVWMGASIVMVDTTNHLIAFVYRAGIYVASTVLFLYVYNHTDPRLGRRIAALLTLNWVWIVGGGFLGILLPGAVVKTPAFLLVQRMSSGLATNDFINHMVVRRFAQYNPESYLGVAARPSAPFLYANNWGNAYSLLLPVVIVYLLMLRRGEHRADRRRFWLLSALVVASIVPASFTLNRGMLIGLGVAALYLALRLAMRGRVVAMVAIAVLAIGGALAFEHLAGQRLETRLQGPGTATRASLYSQSLDLVPRSPLFGFGVPPTSEDPSAPPVGTQGQFWMVLVSNGPVAVLAFTGFFLLAWLRSWRRRDGLGLVVSALCFAGVIELGFYGVIPYGLPLMMVAAALALRSPVASRLPDVVTAPSGVLHWPAHPDVPVPVLVEQTGPAR